MTEDSSGAVLLTGAAGGLGRAIARAVVASGRRIVLVDRNAEALAEFPAELGKAAHPVQLDITDHAQVDRILGDLPSGFSRVDALIDNAGHDIGGRTRLDQGSSDDGSNNNQTNQIGTMIKSRRAQV